MDNNVMCCPTNVTVQTLLGVFKEGESTPSSGEFLLLESGDNLLLEDGSNIELE